MNITVIGIIISILSLTGSQLIEGASLSLMLQPTAFLLVVGGTAGAALTQSSFAQLILAFKSIAWLFKPPIEGRERHLAEIVGWARVAYKDGALKLDPFSQTITDPLMRSGIEMIVDQYEPEYIRDTLLTEVRIRDARLQSGAKVWESAGGYAPTLGILGSILSLLRLVPELDNVSKLGSGIAAAFIATVYGLALANLICLPVAFRLRSIIFELTLRDELRIEGLVMIAQGKQPRLVEKSLNIISEQLPKTPLRMAA